MGSMKPSGSLVCRAGAAFPGGAHAPVSGRIGIGGEGVSPYRPRRGGAARAERRTEPMNRDAMHRLQPPRRQRNEARRASRQRRFRRIRAHQGSPPPLRSLTTMTAFVGLRGDFESVFQKSRAKGLASVPAEASTAPVSSTKSLFDGAKVIDDIVSRTNLGRRKFIRGVCGIHRA